MDSTSNEVIDIFLAPKYSKRIERIFDDTLLTVYGDMEHDVLIGRVESVSAAVRLLDGYDAQLSRRRLIVEKLKDSEE